MDVENFDDNEDNVVDNEDNDMEISESIKQMDEAEINYILRGLEFLPLAEKRRLLHSKSSMTEIEWEQEFERRTEVAQKEIDFVRLKNMQSTTRLKETKGATGKKVSVRPSKSRRRKFSTIHDDDDDDDDDEEEDEEPEESEEEVEEGEEIDERSDGSDDLFDSDEEEMISRKFEGSKKTKSIPARAKKARLAADSDDNSETGEEKRGDKHDKDDGEIDSSPPASFKDCLKLQLRRDLLMKWVSEPFFEQAVLHNFVRLSMGVQNNITVYAMAEIVAVKDGFKHYKVDNKSTDVRLDLAIGSSIRRFRISLISNSRITEHEFQLFVARSTDKLLTEREAAVKRKQLVEATQYHKYTNNEINQMISKNRITKAVTTNQATALESLNKRLTQAYEEQNDTEIALISKAKEKLEAQIQQEKILVERVAGAQVSLNKRNKERNFQKDFQAGIRRADEFSSNKHKSSEKSKDPFIRRETRPQNIWNTGAKLEVERQRGILKAKLKKLQDENLSESQEAKNLQSELAALDESDATKKSSSSVVPEANVGKAQEFEEWKSGILSIEEVRERAIARLGVDPIAVFEQGPLQRYLQRTCSHLPLKGSESREKLRGGFSLREYLDKLSNEKLY